MNDYLEAADSASLRPAHITLCAWVKPQYIGDVKILGKSIYSTAYSEQYALWITNSGKAAISIKRNSACEPGSGWYGVASQRVLQAGEWYSITGTWDGAVLDIHVNGMPEGSNDNVPAGATDDCPGGTLRMGLWWASYPQWFHGIIDEVRIYDRALDEDEIRQLYEWTPRPDPEPDYTEGDQGNVSGTSNDPVNTATGSFFHQETDLSIPSRGSPLTFTRFYNSKAAAPGRKTAKSRQAPSRQTATSQPASTKDGQRSSIHAKKPDESLAGKDKKQPAGTSLAPPQTKEDSK